MFYVMAELWGSVVVSVLFWGFANTITTVDEAEQFYPFFGLGANVALIASGQTVRCAMRNTHAIISDSLATSTQKLLLFCTLNNQTATTITCSTNARKSTVTQHELLQNSSLLSLVWLCVQDSV